MHKVGLVLSGGGAKGAYQVGVCKALLESGTQIGAVAGASIGALNAAVLASAPSFEVGVERLEELWQTLAKSSPLEHNAPAYLSLLLASGLKLNGLDKLTQLAKIAGFNDLHSVCKKLGMSQFIPLFHSEEQGILSDRPLNLLMDKYFDPDSIKNGLPLYVSVYKSEGGVGSILNVLKAEIGLSESKNSEFLHIQSLARAEQKEALLASAALPILFAPRTINGSTYSDGGMGGWQKSQGNTPITPLLEAGFKNIIVTHLSDGSLWSRQDFADANIIEIRPQSTFDREGGAKDLLGFDPHKIPSWIEQGYVDTMHCIGRVMTAQNARNTLKESEKALAQSHLQFAKLDTDLDNAMKRLS